VPVQLATRSVLWSDKPDACRDKSKTLAPLGQQQHVSPVRLATCSVL
jgi:hypothetical protein